ncbi:MAG: 50S ribosomal protein L22 [Candidatus Shikimatogenerans bostrichidophilus]|nr:MAG: 50S ribosomal protein L22 [Candidatus Shikimatogenerans bostrichidophilus]
MGKRKRISSNKINKTKEIYSLLRYVKISPRKIRSVINIIKGKNLNYSLNILRNYISNKISNILIKLILSAISNYKNKTNINISEDKLYIKNILVNSAGIKKKIKYVSQGRSILIKNRRSHIKLIINKKNGTKNKSNS